MWKEIPKKSLNAEKKLKNSRQEPLGSRYAVKPWLFSLWYAWSAFISRVSSEKVSDNFFSRGNCCHIFRDTMTYRNRICSGIFVPGFSKISSSLALFIVGITWHVSTALPRSVNKHFCTNHSVFTAGILSEEKLRNTCCVCVSPFVNSSDLYIVSFISTLNEEIQN